MQVGVPAGSVGQPRHGDLAEYRGQGTLMPALHTRASHPGGVGHLVQALLAVCPQVQVVLRQLTQQLPPLVLQMCLQFGVSQVGGGVAGQPAHQRLEALP
jgi:hypothetical protein